MASYKSQQLTNVDGQGAEKEENGTFFGRKRQDWFNVNSTDRNERRIHSSRRHCRTRTLASRRANPRHQSVQRGNWGTDVDLDIGLFGTDGSGSYDKAGTADDDDFLVADYDLATAVTAVTSILEPALATETIWLCD